MMSDKTYRLHSEIHDLLRQRLPDWRVDNYGNHKSPDGTRRWHFKSRVVRYEGALSTGGWAGIISYPITPAGRDAIARRFTEARS